MAGPSPAGWLPDDFGAAAILARIRGSLREGVGNGAREMTFGAFGTGCRIAYVATPPVAAAFSAAVLTWVAAFEAKWSRFWDASLVSRINAAAGKEPVAIDPDADRIFALCHELHFLTRGVFDPTALPLLKLWDWRRQRTALPTDAEIAEAKALVGWRGVQRAPGKIFLPRADMGIDLGGMGKEYAVDQVAMLARAHGCTSALVDFGADIRAFGPPPDGRAAWHIGLEDPRKPGACWTSLSVLDAAVATSGDYVRKFDADGTRYGAQDTSRPATPEPHLRSGSRRTLPLTTEARCEAAGLKACATSAFPETAHRAGYRAGRSSLSGRRTRRSARRSWSSAAARSTAW